MLGVQDDFCIQLHEPKIDLIKWMIGLLIAQSALLAALFDALAR